MGICLSNKYSETLFYSSKKSTTDTIRTASKRAIQKSTEATSDLFSNEIAHKITSASNELHSKSLKELHSKKLHSKELHSQNDNKLETPKERYISPEKIRQVIDELRLV